MPSFDFLLPWVHHYGYAAIFALLLLGIVGLPVPDEWLLLFAGYLVEHGELSLFPAVLTAAAGAAAGISVSYLLGRGPGRLLVDRWGFLFRLDRGRLDRVRDWYDRRGRWLLTFGFYLPGIRHLVAIVAGTSAMRWPEFALFAYAGALLWAATFVLCGYWLGEAWRGLAEQLRSHQLVAIAVLAVLLGLWALFRLWRRKHSAKEEQS